MRGLISSNPAPSAVRLLVGSHLLLLVQAGLVLTSRAPRDTITLVLIAAVTITAIFALVAAIAGEPAPPHEGEGHGHDR